MKIIIPTKGRAATISTHRAAAFQGRTVLVVVHDEAERDAYRQADNGVIDEQIVVSGCAPDAYGLTRQREWATENLAEPDEWFVFADDNITAVTGLAPQDRTGRKLNTQAGEGWAAKFRHELSGGEWDEVAAEDVARADWHEYRMVAFATTGNHYFRGTKWREIGYGIGKMMLWRADQQYRWDHTITMEDFRNTAEHVERYGGLLIDNWVFPTCTHYQAGGMGTYAERIPYRKADVIRLMDEYRGFFRVKDRAGFEPGTDLAVRFTTTRQVDGWRSRR